MTAVSVEGAELYYSARGTGPTCLVLSGIGTRPYEVQTPSPLTDRFRLVYVDLRGSGRSTGEARDLTFNLLSEDLEAIRTSLGQERVAVLGHSILGILAIEYGRRCPETVSHVIAVGTPPRGDMARVSALAAGFFDADASEDRKRVLQDNLARLPPDASLMQSLLAQTPKRFFDERFDAAPLFAEAIRRPELLMHVMSTLAPGWNVTVGRDTLQVPVFIGHGRYDYVVPCGLWNDIEAELPTATLRIFQESGHQPFFEEPDRFALELKDWMRRQP